MRGDVVTLLHGTESGAEEGEAAAEAACCPSRAPAARGEVQEPGPGGRTVAGGRARERLKQHIC